MDFILRTFALHFCEDCSAFFARLKTEKQSLIISYLQNGKQQRLRSYTSLQTAHRKMA